jgi:hypothetical protein
MATATCRSMVACGKDVPTVQRPRLGQDDGSIGPMIANRMQTYGRGRSGRDPRQDADLSASGALSLVDVPPFLRTEGYLIEKLFVVVAAALLGPTLSWGSDYLSC